MFRLFLDPPLPSIIPYIPTMKLRATTASLRGTLGAPGKVPQSEDQDPILQGLGVTVLGLRV